MTRRLAWVTAAALLMAPSPMLGQGIPNDAACVQCHRDLDEDRLVRPVRNYPDDVHAGAGFGCLDCHGPAGAPGTHELDPAAGFLSAPARDRVPTMCGRCHSDPAFMRGYDPSLRVDQVAEYYTSIHGQRLRELGDPDVATCVSCHPAHEILPPENPESSVYPLNVADLCGSCHADTTMMAGHDVGVDQLEKYRRSVHGQLMFEEEDLSAPTCNDCHGNHGAAPPGVGSVHNVCGECHAIMDGLFSDSGHDTIFTAENLPGCATCHGHHDIEDATDQDLDVRNDEVCQSCHQPGDNAAYELYAMRLIMDSLQSSYARSDSILQEAENLGMEVSQSMFELEDALTALTKARAAIHAFDADAVLAEVQPGLEATSRAEARGLEALEEHDFRRIGLAGSVSIIFFLILALALKIRAIEGRTPERPT